ncbi:MAG: hypothetical protein ACE5OZ_14945 [Candidatus Heimdallarchaeota archaeon]
MTDLRRIIQKSFVRGWKTGQEELEPFTILNLQMDPFAADLPLKDEKTYFADPNLIADLVGRIGAASREHFKEGPSGDTYNLLLTGPTGVGKSLFAKMTAKTLSTMDVLPGVGKCTSTVLDAANWSRTATINENERELANYKAYEEWLSKIESGKTLENQAIKDSAILFIDNISLTSGFGLGLPAIERLLQDLETYSERKSLIVGLLNTAELLFFRSQAGDASVNEFLQLFQPRPLKLPLFPLNAIRQMLRLRLKAVISISNPFPDDIVAKIANNSLGLPKLAMKLGRECMHEAVTWNEDTVSSEMIQKLIIDQGFDTANTMLQGEFSGKSTDDRKSPFLSRKKREILRAILFNDIKFQLTGNREYRGTTSTQLADILNRELSTISYHIRGLTTEWKPHPFLISQRDEADSRSTRYFLVPPLRNLVELMLEQEHTVRTTDHLDKALPSPS